MPSRNSAQQLPEAWRLLALFFSGGEGDIRGGGYTYGRTYSKSTDQPGKVANPERGQLNEENENFSVLVRA